MRRGIAIALAGAALLAPAQAQAFEEEVVLEEDPPALSRNTGCKRVDIARVGRSVLGFVVYKFRHVKRWCWDAPRVTSASSSTYVTDVDPNWDYKGIVSASGSYYTYCCGVTTSGHVSIRQGRFDNCLVVILPCTKREYPWVKIWVRGDGTYSYRTGT